MERLVAGSRGNFFVVGLILEKSDSQKSYWFRFFRKKYFKFAVENWEHLRLRKSTGKFLSTEKVIKKLLTTAFHPDTATH